MENFTKKQQFVPQFYLNFFSSEEKKGKIWCYNKPPNPEPRLVSISSVAYRTHYYTQINQEGEKNIDIENFLAEIEGKAAKIIKNLEFDTKSERVIIDSEQEGLLAFFTALQFSRGPSFRDGIEEFHGQIHKQNFEKCVEQ